MMTGQGMRRFLPDWGLLIKPFNATECRDIAPQMLQNAEP